MDIKNILSKFTTDSIQNSSVELLSYIGIKSNVITNEEVPLTSLFDKPTKAVSDICKKINESYFACTISDLSFNKEIEKESLEEAKAKTDKYEQIFVFAIGISNNERINRSEIATITRALNSYSKAAPVLLITKYYEDGNMRVALSLCERTAYKQVGHTGEKAGKVNILRGINTIKPHTGHIRILEEMRLEKEENTFETVYKKWLKVFDNDALTNDFYKELQNWFFWALKPESGVRFPNDIHDNDDDMKYNPQNIIRLITRLIFVWFLREKGLVPKELFDRDSLDKIIKDFEPDNFESSTYYRVILQNLFFATLNKKIEDREFVDDNFIINRNQGKHNIKTFMRHASDLKISKEEFIDMMRPVPFMNNSLFECLDNKVQDGNNYNWDGFSENIKDKEKQAFVPNYLFFAKEECVDLSDEYGRRGDSSIKVFGLLNILKRYTFTVEENTPLDQDVALDPELLGKVFENLLAAYNPETGNTVRKSTGSYYTPRSIVQYMVDESLIAYISIEVPSVKDKIRDLLRYEYDIEDNILNEEQTRSVAKALLNCKILDPACGSGAFPMGMLQQMSHLLGKIDRNNKIWEDVVMERAFQDEASLKKSDKQSIENDRREMEKVFNLSAEYPDYARKLYLIENCIYGSDIQSIAVQITRLRFFISLLCEQKPDLSRPDNNYNIKPLPNLEMKFVSANSLINIENIEETRQLFKNKEILDLIEQLKNKRHKLFVVTDNNYKKQLLEEDEKLRNDIKRHIGTCSVKEIDNKIKEDEIIRKNIELELEEANKLSDVKITEAVSIDLFGENKEIISYSPKERKIKKITERLNVINKEIKKLNDIYIDGKDKAERLAKQLTDWNPYDQNVSSSFFDPDWMFGVSEGFDIVIGNPPYMRIQEIRELDNEFADKLSAKYVTATGSFDLYVTFVERAVSLVKPSGIIYYIMPTKWTNSSFGKGLRDFLIKNKFLSSIINFGAYQAFDASTYTGIHRFQSSDTVSYIELDRPLNNNKELDEYLRSISNNDFVTLKPNTSDAWVLTNKQVSKILDKLNEQPYRLSDIFSKIFQGIATSKDDVYFLYDCLEINDSEIEGFSKYLNERVYIEKSLVKPLLKGEDVHRYDCLKSNRYVIFPYILDGEKAELYKEEDIKNFFPKGYKYLKQCENVLRGREKGRLLYDNFWYRYIYPKNLTLFSKEKLVAPEISLGGNFSYDNNGQFYSTTTIYGYIKRDNIKVSYETLLAIMNSFLCWWFLKNTGTVLANGYYRYKPAYLKSFPIPEISYEDDLLIRDMVVTLSKVDKNNKRDEIEKEINQVIYRLYHLNQDDISYIEK